MNFEEAKNKKKEKKYICPTPFEFVEIHPDGEVYPCHYALEYKYSIGNIFEEPDFEKIWNGEKSQEFRRSILERDYCHCHPEQCGEPKWYDEYRRFNMVMPKFPEILEINPDYGCNVRCIICRDEFNRTETKFIKKWDDNVDNIVIPMLKDAKIFYTSGVGEIFCSPVTERLIKRVSEVYPDIKFNVSSNGILFDKEHCDKLGITDKLSDVDISIHAATEETYNKIVRNGNFAKVKKNVEWLASKYRKKELDFMRINFVVMSINYKEMKLFQKWANELGVETSFWEYRSWDEGLYAEQHYKELAIFNKDHPEHNELLKVVRDPIFKKNCFMNSIVKCEGERLTKPKKRPKPVEHFELTEEHKKLEYKNKKDLPKKIRLDASTVCQLKCPECYMVQNEKKVKTKGCKHGFLKFENFKKLVDENKFEVIELSNSGEIFLNPDLVKIIEYAYKKKIKLTAENGVNLNNLTDEQAEALAKYKFKAITVSLDGASQRTYKKYRINGQFDTVIDNIKKIIKYKKIYKTKSPYIEWKFIIFGHNEHEIEKAKKMAKDLGIEIVFERAWNEDFSPVKNQQAADEATGTTWKRDSFEQQIEEFEQGNIDWFDCQYVWDQPQINWDGRLLGCCALYWDDFGANVFEDGYMNALNSPKYVYAKNMLTDKAPAAKDIPCTKCRIYKDLCKQKKWPFHPPQQGEE